MSRSRWLRGANDREGGGGSLSMIWLYPINKYPDLDSFSLVFPLRKDNYSY